MKALFIFSPLLYCLYSIWRLGSSSGGVLLYFNRLTGNDYVITDVLLAFIAASYVTVACGLAIYLVDIVKNLDSHRGEDAWVRRCALGALLMSGIAAILLSLYIILLVLVCTSQINISLNRFISFDKALSIIVFALFTCADILIYRSQVVQRREAKALLDAARKGNETRASAEYELSFEKSEELVHFAKASVWVVSVPTLVVTVGAVLLVLYLQTPESAFHLSIEASLHNYHTGFIDAGAFELFLEGLESGVIATTIFFSQLVYLFLQTRYENDVERIVTRYEQKIGEIPRKAEG